MLVALRSFGLEESTVTQVCNIMTFTILLHGHQYDETMMLVNALINL